MGIGRSAIIQNCRSRGGNNCSERLRRKSDIIRNECVRDSAVCEACNGVDAASFHPAATARLCHTHCARKDDGLHHGWRVNLNIGPHTACCGRRQHRCDCQQQEYSNPRSHTCKIAAEQWSCHPMDTHFDTDRPDAVGRKRRFNQATGTHHRRIGGYGDSQPK